MRRGSSFHVVRTRMKNDADVDIVWLVDDDGSVSITNDADNVVAQVAATFGHAARIIYRDTDGNWDELLHDGARFTGFAPARDMAPEVTP